MKETSWEAAESATWLAVRNEQGRHSMWPAYLSVPPDGARPGTAATSPVAWSGYRRTGRTRARPVWAGWRLEQARRRLNNGSSAIPILTRELGCSVFRWLRWVLPPIAVGPRAQGTSRSAPPAPGPGEPVQDPRPHVHGRVRQGRGRRTRAVPGQALRLLRPLLRSAPQLRPLGRARHPRRSSAPADLRLLLPGPHRGGYFGGGRFGPFTPETTDEEYMEELRHGCELRGEPTPPDELLALSIQVLRADIALTCGYRPRAPAAPL